MRNRPVISTAKVRGLIKKNNISYVDATRRLYPSIASGLSVWQLGDSVYVRAFGDNWDAYVASLNDALNQYGFALQNKLSNDRLDTFTVVKVGA